MVHPGAVNEADVPNVVAHGFGGRAPRTHICSDLASVRVGASWNYVCLLVDLCNGEIVGHSTGPRRDARAPSQALGLRALYNNFRIHSTLGYMSPVEFREAGPPLPESSKLVLPIHSQSSHHLREGGRQEKLGLSSVGRGLWGIIQAQGVSLSSSVAT